MLARPIFLRTLRHKRLTALLLGLALVCGVIATGFPAPARAAGGEYTIFSPTTVPVVDTDSDKVPVELGMKFRSSVAGTITGVRFYKSATNLGIHTGSLWTSPTNGTTGTRLNKVTFTNETASGWQTAKFSAPTAISANTTYIISYLAPKGQYGSDDFFWDTNSAGVTSGPLTALGNGVEGGNGVYRYGSTGGFPQSTYKGTNYYVDAIFSTTNYDDVKPTITDRTPAPGATGVSRMAAMTATFSEAVDPNTINATLTTGTAPNQTSLTTTKSYDATTRILTVRSTTTLANTTSYTLTVSGAKDTSPQANQMDPVSWSFTTATDPGGCPCTIFLNTAEPVVKSAADASATTLGVRFRSSLAGYVTGLRFYKGAASNSGPHQGSLWDNAGNRLAGVTFANETDSGWQTASFSGPVQIAANTTYVASYSAPSGFYSASYDFFTTSYGNGPLTALASGTDGLNGVYSYSLDQFPRDSFRATNYYVDVVFDTSAVDGLPPTVVAKTPAAGATGVAISSAVAATFSENVVDSSISIALKKVSDNSAVAGSTSYTAATRQARFVPAAALAYSTQYTATVSGAKDSSGNVMATTSWSFTTAAAPPPPPDQGPGGPIAVITSNSNPYSKYYAEILRTEGLNEFATVDVSSITSAAALAPYDVVLVGEVPVTAAQATLLRDWVTAGGNLIAMRPGATLTSLLGITSAGGSISDGYLKINPAVPGGAGLVSETIQYHGPADRYTADAGTDTVAALYSDATTPVTSGSAANPAVTTRAVGSAGGQVVAFSYDLAKSVALTRQGNIAWAGTERDNKDPP